MTTGAGNSTVDFWTVSIIPLFLPQSQSCSSSPGAHGLGE